jgi:hypothetical protein
MSWLWVCVVSPPLPPIQLSSHLSYFKKLCTPDYNIVYIILFLLHISAFLKNHHKSFLHTNYQNDTPIVFLSVL